MLRMIPVLAVLLFCPACALDYAEPVVMSVETYDLPLCDAWSALPDLSLDMGPASDPWLPVDEFDVIAVIADQHADEADLVLRTHGA